LKVFLNRVLIGLFGTKRGEVEGGWRRLYSEKFYSFFALPNIIQVTKSKRMWWVVHGLGGKII